ncbi:MAG: hypothetical protein CME70_09560 [Halobacteriovorax sp.]|nr:hypothetical protein [Halobacteriovorax sp.]|tara:strand:- start:155363 stop:155698 length:336 start_codon:yes stop_codon:yes gene_type:complete
MQKQPGWQSRFQEILQTCQDEVKRTTEIGKKMLTASRTNTNLHEAHEELGQLVVRSIESGELKWENPKVIELLEKIKDCEKDLETIEEEVNKIKFAAGPVDVSKDEQPKQD